MGLVGGILEPLYLGGRTILMSPRSFLQRPIRWLKYISDYGAVISSAPNFAYQLCVDRISPEQSDTIDPQRWRDMSFWRSWWVRSPAPTRLSFYLPHNRDLF